MMGCGSSAPCARAHGGTNAASITKVIPRANRMATFLLIESASVFSPKRIFLLFSIAVLLPAAHAETIRLKNGRVILADHVQETGNKVEYTVGENTFAISKSLVERIDTGGVPVVTRHDDMQAPEPSPSAILVPADLEAKLIHDGRLDTDYLGEVERSGGDDKAAVANYLASKFEHDAGRTDSAYRYLERARTFAPSNPVILGQEASLLIEMGKFSEAATLAERAVRVAPNEAFSYTVLGYCYFQQSKTADAIKMFKKSLSIQPDPEVQQLLAKAERELATENGFEQEASSHFTLRYEGKATEPGLRLQLLAVLEQHYNDLVRDLNFSPRESISVILYTEKQYFNVTRAPAWSGALYDGKLRMPINGITQVDSDLSRTLKHELTHSFINQITKGRCPTWLNEGIAQLEEPQSSSGDGRRLAQLFSSGRNIPFNQLEGSWVKYSSGEAAVAYAEALIASEYIRDTYGMSDLALVLKRLGEGQGTEAALRSTIHSGYAQFEGELTRFLSKTYGD